MEKHKCKLCFRSFSNGRALGGHMRSHMMNLPFTKAEEESSRTIQLSFEAESAPSSSSSPSSEDEGNDDEKGLCYGLRENPKRSIRLVDPEFSFAAADTGSVILQEDRESETETSKNNNNNNPTRRRSKRAWKIGGFDYKYNHHNNYNKQVHDHEATVKKIKLCKPSNKTESWVDHEPVSSVSDATTEEDVAFCLMMLSRDQWKRQKDQRQQLLDDQYEEEEEEEEEEDEEDEAERSLEESDESQELMKLSKNKARRGRYKCETCNKVFRSYQALGGHRASHKKIRVNITVDEPEFEGGSCRAFVPNTVVEKKIHECPVCFRVFASGQALGGHKRTHVNVNVNNNGSATAPVSSSTKFGKSLIDLNLPAPIDEDDISQIDNSAVSDAEFVKTH